MFNAMSATRTIFMANLAAILCITDEYLNNNSVITTHFAEAQYPT